MHIFVYNCCIFLCYYIQVFPLCYLIGIFWHIFMSVNPFIHKYMALCVLKRNLIPEYLLSWFFFHGRCRLRPVTSASSISPVNIHITFYILLQKDAYVCRIILRRRVLRKGMKIWSGFRMQRRERCRKSTMNDLYVSNYFILLFVYEIQAKAKESSRCRYIFFVSPSFYFFQQLFARFR